MLRALTSSSISHGFLKSLIGVIGRPRSTFQALAAAPRWAGVLVFLTVVAAASQALLLATEVGQVALVDRWESRALAFGQDVDDVRYAQLQNFSRNGPLYGVATAVASGPVLTTGIAAAIFMFFRTAPGVSVSFVQVLSVIAHGGVILVLRDVISAPISYVTEASGNVSLGRLFSAFDETSPVSRLLSAMDLFIVWWVLVLAVGVAVLYQRKPVRLAGAFLGVYVAGALLLTGAMALFGQSA